MFNVGGCEILVILVMALLVLGPERLPSAGRQIGRALAEFRRVSSGVQSDLREALNADELLETVGSIRDAVDIRGTIRNEISSVTSAFSVSAFTESQKSSASEGAGKSVAPPDGILAGDRVDSNASGTIVASPQNIFRDVLIDPHSATTTAIES